VRLGKYVLKDLLVSYQRTVGGANNDRYVLSVSYRLQDRVRVTYTNNDQGESRLKVEYDVGF